MVAESMCLYRNQIGFDCDGRFTTFCKPCILTVIFSTCQIDQSVASSHTAELTKYWIEPYRLRSIRASLDVKPRNVKHFIRLLTIELAKGITIHSVRQ
jgi:hypothetical protein